MNYTEKKNMTAANRSTKSRNTEDEHFPKESCKGHNDGTKITNDSNNINSDASNISRADDDNSITHDGMYSEDNRKYNSYFSRRKKNILKQRSQTVANAIIRNSPEEIHEVNDDDSKDNSFKDYDDTHMYGFKVGGKTADCNSNMNLSKKFDVDEMNTNDDNNMNENSVDKMHASNGDEFGNLDDRMNKNREDKINSNDSKDIARNNCAEGNDRGKQENAGENEKEINPDQKCNCDNDDCDEIGKKNNHRVDNKHYSSDNNREHKSNLKYENDDNGRNDHYNSATTNKQTYCNNKKYDYNDERDKAGSDEKVGKKYERTNTSDNEDKNSEKYENGHCTKKHLDNGDYDHLNTNYEENQKKRNEEIDIMMEEKSAKKDDERNGINNHGENKNENRINRRENSDRKHTSQNDNRKYGKNDNNENNDDSEGNINSRNVKDNESFSCVVYDGSNNMLSLNEWEMEKVNDLCENGNSSSSSKIQKQIRKNNTIDNDEIMALVNAYGVSEEVIQSLSSNQLQLLSSSLKLSARKGEFVSSLATSMMLSPSASSLKDSYFDIPACPSTGLEEDIYVSSLSKIIQRDYYPDLPYLRLLHRLLHAKNNKDYDEVQQLRKQIDALTPITPLVTSSLPSNYPLSSSVEPSLLASSLSSSLIIQHRNLKNNEIDNNDRTEHDYADDNNSEKTATNFDNSEIVNTNFRLDDFQKLYTSEDNQSFDELYREEKKRKQNQQEWIESSQNVHNQNMLSIQKDTLQGNPSNQLALNFLPSRNLLYFPNATYVYPSLTNVNRRILGVINNRSTRFTSLEREVQKHQIFQQREKKQREENMEKEKKNINEQIKQGCFDDNGSMLSQSSLKNVSEPSSVFPSVLSPLLSSSSSLPSSNTEIEFAIPDPVSRELLADKLKQNASQSMMLNKKRKLYISSLKSSMTPSVKSHSSSSSTPFSLNTPHLSLTTPHSSFNTPHSIFNTPHSSVRTPQAAQFIPHSGGLPQQVGGERTPHSLTNFCQNNSSILSSTPGKSSESDPFFGSITADGKLTKQRYKALLKYGNNSLIDNIETTRKQQKRNNDDKSDLRSFALRSVASSRYSSAFSKPGSQNVVKRGKTYTLN